MQSSVTSPILVTGASGYVASHLIKLLLEKGHKVRGTVRSLANKDKYGFLYDLLPEKNDNLELVEGDLSEKTCWLKAVDGCEYVFHVASPIPPYVPKDEMEVIGPAVAGTENILVAALEKNVKKVVVTSGCLTIILTGNDAKQVSEEDWSNEAICPAYPKSKVRAEKVAWAFYEQHKDKIAVTTLLPSLVMGPVYIKHGNSSESLIKDILEGSFPGAMDATVGFVDVRDVAQGHYQAMFKQGTDGRRYACTAQEHSLEELITILKNEFEKSGYQIKDKKINKEEAIASGSTAAQRFANMIGRPLPHIVNERSVKELGMQYTSFEKTIIDMGHSLIKHGVVKKI